MEIGNQLRETRLAKGLTLQDVEEATKIRVKYIDALEKEQFDLLPGKVYVIAFLRNYARFLGINDDDLVQQFKAINAKPADEEVLGSNKEKEKTHYKRVKKQNAEKASKYRKQKSRISTFLIAAVAVILVAAIALYQNYNGEPDSNSKPQAVQNQNDNQNPSENPEPDRNADVKPSGVELTLNVTDAQCWMLVNVDGQTTFSGIANPGETKTYTGQESIYVKLGNAGAVDVVVNGENIGKLAPLGQVVEREFTAEQG